MPAPADSTLKRFFREHPELGQHDRAFVAELAFAVLRHLRLLEQLGAQRSTRRLALASLTVAFGISVRELAPLLRREEETWLAQLRSQAQIGAGSRRALQSARLAAGNACSSNTVPPSWSALARALLQQAPLDLRVNTLLASREEVLAQLAREGIGAESHCVLSGRNPPAGQAGAAEASAVSGRQGRSAG